MLKIGEFSKLSHITVKALRFYEKEGILLPASTDEWTGYRFYKTEQLMQASKIRAYRALGLSIEEIKKILFGEDVGVILSTKARKLTTEKEQIDLRLSIIKSILEEKDMKYEVTEKVIPGCIVYYSEAVLKKYSDIMEWIPAQGAECLALNPGLECASPEYEFLEYLDCGYKETNIHVRHNQAVTKMGKENGNVKFRELPSAKVLSTYHKGPYETISQAYNYIVKYAEENGYKIVGYARECYIDGIWNKENPEDWLTEVQLPIA